MWIITLRCFLKMAFCFVLFWMAHGDHNAIKVNVFHQGAID